MRYKKILLVSPRFYKGRHRLSTNPLAGMGYIAQALSNRGFNISVMDMNLKYSERDLEKKIRDFNPDIIGFSLLTFGHRQVYEMINRIKERHKNIKIAVGGPHVSTFLSRILEDCMGIDFGLVMEADRSFLDLCVGRSFEEIPGFIYRDGKTIKENSFGEFIFDLDSLGFPRYEAFELSKYPLRQIGIVTSRGCPYQCIYCPVIAAIGTKFRQRSSLSVIEEIDYWYKNGYKEILVLDDNFTLVRNRLEEICEGLIKKNFRGLSLKCPNGIRADKVDRDLLTLMRRAGFDTIAFGVESASDKVLRSIKKGENIQTIENSVRNACELGFAVDLFFLIGSPKETMEDLRLSFKLARSYPIRNANFYNIIPFPKTELFEWVKDNNYFLYPIDYILNNTSYFINDPAFFTPEMSACERKAAFKQARKVSRAVRRNFIERKIKGPKLIKRIISIVYTNNFIYEQVTNNSFLLGLKDRAKKGFLKNKQK